MSDEIPNTTGMRVVGGLLVLASIIQIGVAGAAYAMTSWHVGSWWAGVLCCITGIFALISANKGIVTTGCVFSIIAILLCIAGVIFDGIIYGATNALDTCYDRENFTVYGDAQYGGQAINCALQNSQTCLCVQGSNDDTCFLFNLDSADNCGQILTKLPSLLLASLLFVFLLLVLVFTYSIFTCMGVCCVRPPLANQNATPVTATATATNPVAATATVKATPMTANSV
eukprot:GDKK01074369.1.p1 GENE.GDKK01074369.1~~GDKK01074369.1.p1  ORF type:complete len:240 (-),score=46.57 GDKK01074369.1:218-901(-)